MQLLKGLLLGSTAALVSVVSAEAADLPAQPPIEYVRICDAYGAGFFFIPGTDTCLKVGGAVVAQTRIYASSYSVSPIAGGVGGSNYQFQANTVNNPNGTKTTFLGYSPSSYTNATARDAYGWDTLGRVELDARNATPFGTLRAFVRVDAYVGTGYSNTGSLSGSSSFNAGLYFGGSNGATRETTIVSRAFIQFAGLTAGRAQSMFDFYANAYNYQNLNGSAATTQLFAYTATLGNIFNGLSATFSVEDQNARTAAIGNTVYGVAGITAPPYVGITGFGFGTLPTAGAFSTPGGVRVPDLVGNLRVDQPWGAVQLSAAAHQETATLYPTTGFGSFPVEYSKSFGWAIQGGIQLNADYLSAGDKLWLQAAYERGALSYVWGNNLASSFGAVNGNRFYGSGFTQNDSSQGWNAFTMDCVFTASGYCEQQQGWSVVAAYKHFWLPTLSSAVYGSYTQINYSQNAILGYGGGIGIPNLKAGRVGGNLVWTPVKGFDIGAEFMYVNTNQTRPVGLASDYVIQSKGLPPWQGSTNQYETRVRVQRAF
jgi:hypothetical protein